jgi:hypothetical protein
MAGLTHHIDYINYLNADISGWMLAYAWDASFMGGPAAVEPQGPDSK